MMYEMLLTTLNLSVIFPVGLMHDILIVSEFIQ